MAPNSGSEGQEQRRKRKHVVTGKTGIMMNALPMLRTPRLKR
ncbi:MAG TPA: hypothetical protein VK958_04865 [Methylophilus sp.]|nr:hypothetical protein [Methylophilus sp.]HSH86568.1 hypothetical protein [Methylophilus sp.]